MQFLKERQIDFGGTDQRRLTRIIKRDKCATLPQIAADFNAGPSTTPKSPDMNIIEDTWDTLQRAVQKRSPPPPTPLIYGQPCRIHDVNYLQPYFRH
ncbi:hypothetical protein TNCV_141291 [Trichonephila clavipes]|nr:hypothetical protein TNCV_141291 [Trichonephila clavipes]